MSNLQKSFSESGSSPPITATVFRVDLTPGSTVGIGHATDSDGQEFSFAGDWRPMLLIAEALHDGEDVEVWLDGWEIISWGAIR